MSEGTTPISSWVLTKNDDPYFTKVSTKVGWIEFGEDGRGKKLHEQPAIGRSLIMSPFNEFFTWQTTVITSFRQSLNEDEIVFSTKNSNYTLKHKK
jgi:hypothetical protein